MQSIIEYPELSSSYAENSFITFDFQQQGEGTHWGDAHTNIRESENASTGTRQYSRSPAIPLPKSHIHRTESELDLTENIAVAEFRDQCMFNRLVSGIQKQQKLLYSVEIHRPGHPGPPVQTPPPQEQETQEQEAQEENQERPQQRSLTCQSWHEEEKDGWYNDELQARVQVVRQHSSLPSSSSADYNFSYVSKENQEEEERPRLSGRGRSQSTNSDSWSSSAGTKPSTPEECMEENQRSIENIISTRHAHVSLNDTNTSNNSMTRTSSFYGPAVITDGNESSDFGQVFDIEI